MEYLTFEEIDTILDKLFEGKKHYVVYSASDYIDDGSEFGKVANNLDEVAAEGKCIFSRERSDFWGGENSEDYVSKTVVNPTWKDVCIMANKAIKKNNDYHHVFLEDIDFIETDSDGINIYEFQMGS